MKEAAQQSSQRSEEIELRPATLGRSAHSFFVASGQCSSFTFMHTLPAHENCFEQRWAGIRASRITMEEPKC